MAPRTAAVLFGVALLLGAIVYFFEIQGEQRRLQREEEGRALFPKIAPADIEVIRLRTSDDRPVRVERRAGRWQVVSPVDVPADSVAIDGMASTLAQLVWESEIERPESREIYGLDDPERRISFRAGYENGELWIGRLAPSGGRSYVATSAAPDARIFTVPTWRVTSLRKPFDDLRDRRIMPFDRAAVEELEVRWPGGRVLARRSSEGWQLVVPVAGPADPATVEDLLSDLTFMRAEGFEDSPSPEALEELVEPELSVTLRGSPSTESEGAPEEGAAAPLQLRFAIGGFATRRLRYVQGAYPSTLYLLPADRINELPRSVAAFRSRELSRFEAEDAHAIEFVFAQAAAPAVDAAPDAVAAEPSGSESTVLYARRGARGWDAEGRTLDDGSMDALLAELSSLVASRIAAEEMGDAELEALGLKPARVNVRIYAKYPDEGPPQILGAFQLGHSDPKRGTFAMRLGSGVVYAIDPAISERLPMTAEGFLEEHAGASPAVPTSD